MLVPMVCGWNPPAVLAVETKSKDRGLRISGVRGGFAIPRKTRPKRFCLLLPIQVGFQPQSDKSKAIFRQRVVCPDARMAPMKFSNNNSAATTDASAA